MTDTTAYVDRTLGAAATLEPVLRKEKATVTEWLKALCGQGERKLNAEHAEELTPCLWEFHVEGSDQLLTVDRGGKLYLSIGRCERITLN